MCCAAWAHGSTPKSPSSDPRRRWRDDKLHRSARVGRRSHQRRRVPAAGAQPHPNVARALAHRQRRQSVDPDGRRPVGQSAGARQDQRRRDDDRRSAGAGHDPDRHRHQHGHRGVRAVVDLSHLSADHRGRGRERPRGHPGFSAHRRGARSPRRGPARSAAGPRHRRARRTGRATGAGGVAVSTSAVLTPLPVLIPLLGAAATMFAGRRPRLQRGITLAALTAVVAVCCALLYLTDRDGTLALHVGGWAQSVPGMGPLGITLVVDRLSALMLVVSSIVLLAVVFYAIGQGIRDGGEHQPVSIFLPTYLALSAGVCNAFLAGDLFNLFVGFEVLLAASFVLLTLGASADRVRAGVSYVMVSMVSSLIFLFGFAFAYAATGTFNLAELAVRLDGVSTGIRGALF